MAPTLRLDTLAILRGFAPLRAHNGRMRVVVTRIEPDGTMQRRVVDTAQRDDGTRWEDLVGRALASPPAYRPVPGTAVYHVSVDDHLIQAGEYDLDGPLQDLVTVVLAMGDEVLSAIGEPTVTDTGRRQATSSHVGCS
jgi:hypothetical protein